MDRKSWVRILFFILTFFQIADIQAQTIQKKITLTWLEPVTQTFSNGEKQTFLTFENASFGSEHPSLPSFYEIIPVENFFSEYTVNVLDQEFDELSANDCKSIPSDFHQKIIDYHVQSAYDRRQA